MDGVVFIQSCFPRIHQAIHRGSSLPEAFHQTAFTQSSQSVQRRPTGQARLKKCLVSLRLQFRLLSEGFEPIPFDGVIHGEIVARKWRDGKEMAL